jgi:hypothetical protein
LDFPLDLEFEFTKSNGIHYISSFCTCRIEAFIVNPNTIVRYKITQHTDNQQYNMRVLCDTILLAIK